MVKSLLDLLAIINQLLFKKTQIKTKDTHAEKELTTLQLSSYQRCLRQDNMNLTLKTKTQLLDVHPLKQKERHLWMICKNSKLSFQDLAHMILLFQELNIDHAQLICSRNLQERRLTKIRKPQDPLNIENKRKMCCTLHLNTLQQKQQRRTNFQELTRRTLALGNTVRNSVL